ncbi:MAG: hypothetical protein K2K60_01530 [Clostridia bacterium]|nr:hypothetical protein [Clostridia bacterium]
MKKLFLIFTLLCALVVLVSGCGSFSNPPGSTGGNLGNTGSSGGTVQAFTVSLEHEGKKYIPDNNLKAQWYDGSGYKQAEFNSEGVASITGLDGDYSVTLDGLDDRFTYNPNIYFVSNDERDVTITLHTLTPTDGRGEVYHEHYIYGVGYYRATFNSDYEMQRGIFFAYVPLNKGIYTVESYVDLTLNEVNPKLNVYVGNRNYAGNIQRCVDDGSLSSNFTKNFKYEVEVKTVSQSVYYRFAVIFESRSPVSYPFNIDFELRYQSEAGEAEPPVRSVPKPSEEDFTERRSQFSAKGLNWQPSGWTYADINKYYYADLFRFNNEDGLWHVWNKDTNSYGAILWAKIKKDNNVFQTESQTGFADGLVSTNYVNGYNYDSFISNYSANVNGDGCYPVTAELKEFLQNFAINQRYFMDGRGWAEDLGFKATEESQWLFACGYYTADIYL